MYPFMYIFALNVCELIRYDYGKVMMNEYYIAGGKFKNIAWVL